MKQIYRKRFYLLIFLWVILSQLYNPISAEKSVITVSNEQEFITAIGPDRIIKLQPKLYNLSKPTGNNRYVDWEQVHDGWQMIVKDVENLSIEGLGDKRVQIVVQPRYSFVLSFKNVRNLDLDNLDLGHTPEGYCVGGVIYLDNCNEVCIYDSRLYGCGTEGLRLTNVADFFFQDSSIEECTYSIMTIENSGRIDFENSLFINNREFDQINIINSSDVSFEGCEISGNHSLPGGYSLFKITGGEQISIIDTIIKQNKADYFIISDIEIATENLELTANKFKNPKIFISRPKGSPSSSLEKTNPFFTFTDVTWEMSVKEVKKKAKGGLIKADLNRLTYKGKILDFDCTITYSFGKYGLESVVYKIKTKESAASEHNFPDYYRLKESLIQAYGKSVGDDDMNSEPFPSDFWAIKSLATELELWVNPENIDEIVASFYYIGRPPF